jgi:uncharacterized protein YciI
MESIGQMIMNDESPDSIRDAIINSLYAKAAERVEAAKPYVVANVFDDEVDEDEDYEDYEDDDEDEDEE